MTPEEQMEKKTAETGINPILSLHFYETSFLDVTIPVIQECGYSASRSARSFRSICIEIW